MSVSTFLPLSTPRSTRSGGRGRGIRRGSSSPSPYANPRSSRLPGNFSPQHDQALPVGSRSSCQQTKNVSISPSATINDLPVEHITLSTHSGTSAEKNYSNFDESLSQATATSLAPVPQVGDNTEAAHEPSSTIENMGDNSPPGNEDQIPPNLWHKAFNELRGIATQTCQELKAIGIKLNKLEKIESSTDSLAKQMSGVLQRTSALEDRSNQNSDVIRELREEVQTLKSTIAKQEETISDLKKIKSEFIQINADFQKTSQDKVQEFNDLIGVQQKQVDGIQDAIQDNITQYFGEKMEKWVDSVNYNALKSQAQRNKK